MGEERKLYWAEDVKPQCNCYEGLSLSYRELFSFPNYLEFWNIGWTFIYPV